MRAAVGAVLLSLAVLLGPAAPQEAMAQDGAPPSRTLSDTLALLPAEAAADPVATLHFADWQALIAAAERDIDLAIDRLAVGARDYRPAFRAVSGPDGIRQMVRAPTQAEALVGFDWDAVGPALEIGHVPNEVMVLRGPGPGDHAALAAALAPRGFETSHRLGGATVWHRLADGALAPRLAEPADPFWGLFGTSARIAPIADGVIAARLWPAMDAALTQNDTSLDARAPLPSLMAAIDALLPDGARLVQAMGFDAAMAGGPRTAFEAGMLVDAFVGETDVTLVLVSQPDATSAAALADGLAAAFAGVPSGSVDRTYQAVIDRLVGEFEIEARLLTGSGRPVAALVLTTTRDPAMSRQESNYWTNPAFGILADAVFRRDLTFLFATRLAAETRP